MSSLTLRDARHLFLARQGLSLMPTHEEAMAAMVGVQTQYAQSLIQALAARSSEVDPRYEARGLVPGGPLVKSWTLRGTVHTHTMADYSLLHSATGELRYRWFRARAVPHFGMTEDEYDQMERSTLAELEKGPLTRKELHERVPELARTPHAGWGVDVKGLAYRGLVSFIGLGAEQRFARIEPPEPIEEALPKLARRYFMSYAPATSRDFAYWLGVYAKHAKEAVDTIREELCPVEIEGLDLPRFAIGPIEIPEPRAATLLAKFDVATLAHRDKGLLIPEEHQPKVYRIAAQVEAVFLLRGEAAGTWRLVRRTNRIEVVLETWRRILKREAKALERETHRLAKALGVQNACLRIGP